MVPIEECKACSQCLTIMDGIVRCKRDTADVVLIIGSIPQDGRKGVRCPRESYEQRKERVDSFMKEHKA